MMLFFIGIIEMMIVTAWTKLVTKSQILASGIVTLINVLIWYYVLQRIVADISNWRLVLLYATGCALGVVISSYFFQKQEAKAAKALQPSSSL